MLHKYIVLTHQQQFRCTTYREANDLALKLSASGTPFKIWSNLTSDWADDYPASNTIPAPVTIPDYAKPFYDEAVNARESWDRENKPAKKAVKPFKSVCPASNYKVMQNGYDLPGSAYITDDGLCSHCHKPVKMVRLKNCGLIPKHNLPDDFFTKEPK